METLGSATLIGDIDQTLELGKKEIEDAQPIESLRLALAQSSHIIDRSASEIAAQLTGYLRGSTHRRARKLTRELRRPNAGVWLEPLSGSLMGSGLRRVMLPLEKLPINTESDQERTEERHPASGMSMFVRMGGLYFLPHMITRSACGTRLPVRHSLP